MQKLIQKIKHIPKPYYSFADIRKVAGLDDDSLKVALSRLVKSGELNKVMQGIYTTDLNNIDWSNFVCVKYSPSYLSFEWALGHDNILSQKSYALTLATPNRSRTMSTARHEVIYHHINPNHFWGYKRESNYLIAEPEKALLDLAYLSLNGYAKFDISEMNWRLLNMQKLNKYLRRYTRESGSDRLYWLIKRSLDAKIK